MKKFITVIISCSLALAAGAMAQDEDAQATPGKKKQRQQQREKADTRADEQAPSAPQAERRGDKPQRGMKAQEGRAERQNARAEEAPNAPEAAPAKAKDKARARMQTETSAAEGDTSTEVKAETRQGRKGRNAVKANETATATDTAAATESTTATKAQTRAEKRAAKRGQTQAQGQTEGTTTAAQSTQATAATGKGKKTKALEPQAVKKIKTQHANFTAQPKPQQIPAVSFNQSYTISGASQWQGENYSVFRSYRPARHDESYYHSHYNRIELIGGGYYYFDNGYWYPAWGYRPSAQYYVYDGPIYAGRSAERLDRVIANVQAVLQAQGYYRGEVDGLLGPLTREALTGYQSEHGLYTTAAIDQPTLDSLGLN
ncbi:MAG: peptidoglycan-binding domain-containing protein [Chthoniobacterales bacterium]